MPLSTADDIQDEIDQLILAADDYHVESPGPTMSAEKRSSPDDGEGSDSAREDDESNVDNGNRANLNNQTPSEQQLFVKRLAKRLKLNSTQVTDVEKFSKEPIDTKLVVLYGETISLLGKVNQLTENVGPPSFKITKEISDNIRLFIKQIFFNPAVKDYKTDDTIKLLVVDRIHKSLIGIPKDLEEINPQAWVRIESKVSYEVTQLRRSVKKELKKDSRLDPGKQMKIGALTKAIMGKNAAKSELQQFGVEIFMRVVLFRKVYPKHPGDNFWNEVDKLLNNMLKQGKATYEKAMTGLISLDRQKYGVNVMDTVAQ